MSVSDSSSSSDDDVHTFDETKFKWSPSPAVISYNKMLMEKVLEMLSKREGYAVAKNHVLPALRKHESHVTFQSAMLSGSNVMRDTLAMDTIRKKFTPSFRTLMSFLTPNNIKDGSPRPASISYTAVVFPDLSGKTQIPKGQIKVIIKALVFLAPRFNITDVIMVSPAPFSHDSESHVRKIRSGRFLQIFKDTDVLIDPTECIWTAGIDRIVKDKDVNHVIADEFQTNEIAAIKGKLLRISHTDAQMRYLGIRPGSLVFFTRKPLVPGGMVTREKTFALVF